MNSKRFEGRLFAEGGCLFMVIETNEAEGSARVSCRLDDEPVVIDMPLTDVAKRISSSTSLILDNLNSPESARRVLEQDNGWHFSTREGVKGPYETKQEAASELGRYVLSMQTSSPDSGSGRVKEEARSPLRRQSDAAEPVRAVG